MENVSGVPLLSFGKGKMKRGWIFRWRNSLGYNLLQKKKPQNIACPTILRNQSFLCTVDIVLLDENCSFRQKEGGLPAVLLPIPATPLPQNGGVGREVFSALLGTQRAAARAGTGEMLSSVTGTASGQGWFHLNQSPGGDMQSWEPRGLFSNVPVWLW